MKLIPKTDRMELIMCMTCHYREKSRQRYNRIKCCDRIIFFNPTLPAKVVRSEEWLKMCVFVALLLFISSCCHFIAKVTSYRQQLAEEEKISKTIKMPVKKWPKFQIIAQSWVSIEAARQKCECQHRFSMLFNLRTFLELLESPQAHTCLCYCCKYCNCCYFLYNIFCFCTKLFCCPLL